MHLDPEDLKELEEIVLEGTSDPKFVVEIHDAGFTRKYESAHDVLEDRRLPDFLYEFEMTLMDANDQLTIRCSDSEFTSRIYISGNEDWVETKKRDTERFFDRRSKLIRTLLANDAVQVPLFMAVFVGLLLLYGLLISQFVSVEIAGFTSIILVLFTIFALEQLTDNPRFKVFPYTLLSVRGKTHHPYVGLGARLIAIIGGLITIIVAVFEFVLPWL